MLSSIAVAHKKEEGAGTPAHGAACMDECDSREDASETAGVFLGGGTGASVWG